MLQVLALVFFVAAVALWWSHANRQKKNRAVRAARRNAHSSYHCVEVRAGVPACNAVRHLGNVRFLSAEAPSLPVPGCTVQKCGCSYLHHDDRREDDRRNPYGQWANVPHSIGGERRRRVDRRKSQDSTFRPSIAR